MVQCITCLLREHEDLGSDPQHPCENLGVVIHSYGPCTGEMASPQSALAG